MSVNKFITAVNALSNNISIPNENEVICIDTNNNRIGIGTSTPQYDIDISGTLGINTPILNFNESNNDVDINYDFDYLKFKKSILINHDISVINLIDCSALNSNDLCANNVYINSINAKNNNITFDSDVSFLKPVMFQDDVNFQNNTAIFDEISINNVISSLIINGDICCNIAKADILEVNLISGDISFVANHIDFSGDISFIGNIDFSGGNITIDASLVVEGAIGAPIITIRSDDRLKHNEKTINNGLDILRQLEPQFYQKTRNFKSHDFSGILNEPFIYEAGLIAQEIEKIDDLKFSVNIGNETKAYSLNYNNIFVYGLAALKELDTIVTNKLTFNDNINVGNIENLIKSQTLLIQTLNSKISSLENRLSVLEKKNINN